MTDAIEQLAQRLAALEGEPVVTHPGVLDEVHRRLIGELDRLADSVSGESRSSGSPHR